MEYETERRGDLEIIQKANLKRARRQAIAFGIITGVALICIVYAYVQDKVAKEKFSTYEKQADSLKIELRKCKEELISLNSMNELSSKVSAQMVKEADEKLKKTSKK
jgi:hypothetical protein